MAADRRPARAVQHGQKRTFAGQCTGGVGVVDRHQQIARAPIVGAGLDADGALPDRRQEFIDIEDRRGGIGQTQTLEPGQRQQSRVGDTLIELAQPRLDVAAQRHNVQIGTQPLHHRLPPQRRGADAGAARQLRNRVGLAADEGVARVLARQERRQHEAARQRGRHVLRRMHREVDGPRQQRLLDLFGEQPFAAGFRQRPVLDAVAAGADHFDRDPIGIEAMCLRQRLPHHVRLRQCQRAAARSEPQDDVGGWGHETSPLWY
jgi:hypothetical protein